MGFALRGEASLAVLTDEVVKTTLSVVLFKSIFWDFGSTSYRLASTDDELRAFFETKAIPQCGLCPSKRAAFVHPNPLQRSVLK